MSSPFPSLTPGRMLGMRLPSMGGMMRLPGGMGSGMGMRLPGMPRINMMPRLPGLGGVGGGIKGMNLNAGLNPMAGMNMGTGMNLNAGMGGQQLAPGIPAKTPNMALPTEESGLGKFLDFTLGRFVYGPMAGLKSVGEDISSGKTPDLSKAASATWKGLSLDPNYKTSGTDVLSSFGWEQPKSLLGAFVKGVTGASLEMATNPLNYLHLGKLSPEGEALSKADQGVVPGTIGDQMQNGLRNFLQFGPLKTTGAIDTFAGKALNYIGDVTHALASPITDMFTTGKIGPHLQPFASKLEHMNRESVKGFNPEVKAFHDNADLMKQTINDYKNGKVFINAERSRMAELQGDNTPELQVKNAIFRKLNQDTLPSKLLKTETMTEGGKPVLDAKGNPLTRQVDKIAQMDRHANIREAIASGLNYIRQQKLKYADTQEGWYTRNKARMLVADSGEFMSPELHQQYVSDTAFNPHDKALINRVTNSINKQSPSVIQDSIDTLNKGAAIWREKANLLKFDRDNPETFDPKIEALANYIKPTYDEFITPMRAQLGANILPGEEFEGNRSLTKGAKMAREQAGFKGQTPIGGGKQFGVKLNTASRTDLGTDFTADQINRMALNPLLRQEVLHKFGPGQILKPQSKMETLLNKEPQAETIFNTDPMKELGLRLISTKEAVNSANIIKEIAQKFGHASEKEFNLDPANADLVSKGIRPVEVELPKLAQKVAGQKSMFMAPEVANEFRALTEAISSPKSLNNFLHAWDNLSYIWRRMTLFGGPMIMFGTAQRNFFGHGFLSWLKGGISAKGLQAITKLFPLYLKREAILAKGGLQAWEAAKASLPENFNGINLRAAMDDLEKSGMFAGRAEAAETPSSAKDAFSPIRRFMEKPLVTGLGQKIDDAMSFLVRGEHYLTRLSEGYEPGFAGAAMRDTKHSLIDYSSTALSATEREFFKRLSGFYSWTRFNIPLMFEALLNHPGKISAVMSVIRNASDNFGLTESGQKPDESFLDSFIKGNLHIRIGNDSNGNMNYFVLRNWLPLADLEDMTSPAGVANQAFNMLNPFLKLPVEQFFNRSTFFKTPQGEPQPLERFPGEQGSFMGLPMPKRAVVALQELFRPGNVASQYNPLGVFGQSGQTNALGAFRDQAPMSGSQILGGMLGLRPRPFVAGRGMANAQFAFRQAFDTYKNALMRAESRGDVPNIQAATQGLRKLLGVSLPGLPGGHRGKTF